MLVCIERTIPRRTPVYDHADVLMYFVDRETCRELPKKPYVQVIANSRKIKGLRFGPEPNITAGITPQRRPVGKPYDRESYTNVRGVWTIDRIPRSCQPHFVAVVQQCLEKAA
mgnify:FL=1